MNRDQPEIRNGWTLFQHPAFRDQLARYSAEVEELRGRLDDKAFAEHPKVRFLARVRKLILEDIPSDPASKAYELGNTLGENFRHWRRAKFNQRFRLFFRFRSDAKIIVYGWLNDENMLRTRGARNDVYAEFRRRLAAGSPPDDWNELVDPSTGSG